MSLKHQNSGKWAKSRAIMAKYDNEVIGPYFDSSSIYPEGESSSSSSVYLFDFSQGKSQAVVGLLKASLACCTQH